MKKEEQKNKESKTKDTKLKENKTTNKKNEKNKSKKEIKENSKFHKYLWYTIIFGLFGLLVEAIVYLITLGNQNGGNGFILGSLFSIYGLGALTLILCLDKYKGKKLKLFILGTILGTVIQFLISFLLEGISGARFWDYSWSKLNLNGRACLEYSILWGVLSILLINVLKKWIDKLIDKMKGKPAKIIDIILTVILVIDILITIWGVTVYRIRAKDTLNGKNYVSNNNIIEKFQNTVFSNKNMEKIFPNLRMADNDGNMIFVKDAFRE